jgi:hypothetical protein
MNHIKNSMKKSLEQLRKKLIPLLAVFVLPLTGMAQIVSANLTGVVHAGDQPIASLGVTAVHRPSGTVFTAQTNEEGRFHFRNIPVGGPYDVRVAPAASAPKTVEAIAVIGTDTSVDINLRDSQETVVSMAAFVVSAQSNALNAEATGASRTLGLLQITDKPTVQRSLADLISTSPYVTLRVLSGEREEAQLSALGQNNRYNSFQIDGARINDQFGLNGTGFASFFNPIPLESIEQISIQVTPYDVAQAGFTGASVNAVTKSGTNQFHGSLYTFFSGDHLLGLQLQGRNQATGAKPVVPTLDRSTYGFTLGGPIVKNRLFYFVNYEKFKSTASPVSAGLPTVDSADLANIQAGFANLNATSGRTTDWGTLGQVAPNTAQDEKFIGRLDWNINADHRASLRYSSTKGEIPQYGRMPLPSMVLPGLPATGGVNAFSSNFYTQKRTEESWATHVLSQWTTNLKTRISYSTTEQEQTTGTESTSPEILILSVRGINLAGNSIANGVVAGGTPQDRQGNAIFVKGNQATVAGDYLWRNFVFTAGLEREESRFDNLFRFSSYGLIGYLNAALFAADRPSQTTRDFIDLSQRSLSAVSKFVTNDAFVQAKWEATPRLSISAGLRFDRTSDAQRPELSPVFLAATGIRNDGTPSGVSTYSPRVSFNWAADATRKTQVRGGVGHFLGRAPWVFFSNNLANPGVGGFTQSVVGGPTLPPLASGTGAAFIRGFDPANPIGQATDTGAGRREVNWSDDKISLPSVWRSNLAIERQISFLSSIVSVEMVASENDKSLFVTNDNVRPIGLGADGRARFAGTTASAAAARLPAFTDLIHLQNATRAGRSFYYSLGWSRPLKNQWGFDANYTHGRSTDIQALGQTVANTQWQRNAVFQQNTKEIGTSDFEIKHRVQVAMTREFNLWKKVGPTRASLSYEGRSGNPYSFVYGTDINGDGRPDNDLVAIPTDVSDARFDFSRMSATDQTAYFDALKSTGLTRFAGGYAPKNSFVEPWVNRLDVRLSQTFRLSKKADLDVFFDFINFGTFLSKDIFNYREQTVGVNDVFRRRFIGGASYATDGRIVPVYAAPTAFAVDDTQSRWRIQLGAKLRF